MGNSRGSGGEGGGGDSDPPEKLFKWRFAGGPMLARTLCIWILSSH